MLRMFHSSASLSAVWLVLVVLMLCVSGQTDIQENLSPSECRNLALNNLYSASWLQLADSAIYHDIQREFQRLDQTFANENLVLLEGHSGTYMQEMLVYIQAAQNPCVKTICEIGFNGGHSAILWLMANPTAKVVMFDLFEHNYSPRGFEYIKNLEHLFPERISVVIGDSTKTVRELHSQMPNFRCDLISVDGGHSHEVAVADLYNMFYLAESSFNLLMIDDTNCNQVYCVDKALQEAMKAGIVKLYDGISDHSIRGLSIGTYLREQLR